MKVRIRIRHRADCSNSINQFHKQIMETISSIDELWNGQNVEKVELENAGSCSGSNLTPVLKDGFEGAVSYIFRDENYLSDKAMYDDFMSLDIDTDKVDYTSFILDVFPQLVKAMNAYRATVILDEELDLGDYDEIVDQVEKTEKDIDGRDTVYRINSVNYFDRELCLRAFELSPEQIVERLNGKVKSVFLLMHGVLLITSSEIMSRDRIERIDIEVRTLLN